MDSNFRLNGENFLNSEELKNYASELTKTENEEAISIGQFISEWLDDNDFIEVKTSGSTGVPKVISLQKKHVVNSAKATINYFNLFENTKALLCLPSEYIAGKMMLARAMLAGWDLHTVDPGKNPLRNIDTDFDFTAMVPYQVFHSLEDLYKVKKIIIGGGSIPAKLEKQLQQIETLAYATYGMTETISHIAVRQINGKEKSNLFSGLPNVKFSQTSNGCLEINAPKISEEVVITNDVVELLSPTSFKFLGRMDNVINSGGIKIHPEEVEKKLSLQIEIPFFIASEENDTLGEQVILIIESKEALQLKDFSKAFEVLSSYEKPKKLYVVSQFLYTETDKVKRTAVLKILK